MKKSKDVHFVAMALNKSLLDIEGLQFSGPTQSILEEAQKRAVELRKVDYKREMLQRKRERPFGEIFPRGIMK